MRYFCTFILLTIAALNGAANPVSPKKAQQHAALILGGEANLVVTTDTAKTNHIKKVGSPNSTPAYYIFNTSDNTGFAIIAGDDRFPSVVGYALQGSTLCQAEMPDGLKSYLSLYKEYVAAVQAGDAVPPTTYKTMSSPFPASVNTLISASWGQNNPFNKLCPDDAPVGCVATAISQVMHHHQWPSKGTGEVSTTYGTKTLTVNLNNSTYNWTAMKTTTIANNKNTAAQKAVSRLCYDVGVAVKMQYSSSGSGAYTYDVPVALYTNFGYKAQGLRLLLRDCYATAEEWMDIIKGELSEGRPVYYAGTSPQGGGSDAAGHAFLLDGYDEQDYVHVNWGWDGSYNGYFDVALLDPASYSFSEEQEMIVGITPAKDGNAGDYMAYPYIEEGLTTSSQSISYPSGQAASFEISVPNVWNITTPHFKWEMTVALYDAEGNFLTDLMQDSEDRLIYDLDSYTGASVAEPLPLSIPAGLATGQYVMRFVCRKAETRATWELPDMLGGKENNYLRMVIADGNATFDKEPITTGIRSLPVGENVSKDTYNINGQRVSECYKGIVIKNGKKIGVK